MRLARDTYATGIHDITRRPTEEGTLAAGTLVRNVRAWVTDPNGNPIVTVFEASTDGGKRWYRQRTHGHVEVLP